METPAPLNGLLGAMLGRQLGLEVRVLARGAGGPKPDLVPALGTVYHSCNVSDIGFEPDIIMECTGVGRVISESTSVLGASGVICLTGVGYGGAITQVPAANVASSAMLKNSVMFGSVNANKRHWQKAAEALERAGRNWLSGLLTRFEKPERLGKAFERNPEEIKTIIQFKG